MQRQMEATIRCVCVMVIWYDSLLAYSDKEVQIRELNIAYDIHLKSSERSVEEYKTKAEQQMSTMFSEMRGEVPLASCTM